MKKEEISKQTLDDWTKNIALVNEAHGKFCGCPSTMNLGTTSQISKLKTRLSKPGKSHVQNYRQALKLPNFYLREKTLRLLGGLNFDVTARSTTIIDQYSMADILLVAQLMELNKYDSQAKLYESIQKCEWNKNIWINDPTSQVDLNGRPGHFESADFLSEKLALSANTILRFSNLKVKKSFDEAQTICSRNGGKLFEPRSSNENEFAAYNGEKITIFTHPTDTRYDWWIGADDIQREGSFVWTKTKEAIDFSNWNQTPREEQPDNGNRETTKRGTENCVAVRTGDSSNFQYFGKWFDESCSNKNSFICEYTGAGLERAPRDSVNPWISAFRWISSGNAQWACTQQAAMRRYEKSQIG